MNFETDASKELLKRAVDRIYAGLDYQQTVVQIELGFFLYITAKLNKQGYSGEALLVELETNGLPREEFLDFYSRNKKLFSTDYILNSTSKED